MRKLLLAVAAAGAAACATASPAAASVVTVVNDGPCHYAVVAGQSYQQYELCYLGPPPPQ